MAIAGRVEAKYTNPSSADVTLTPANYSSGQTVSLAAGSYFHTAAGSVSGGLATWQTALNAAANGYPRTAASMAAAVGYGTWSAGWLLNIASGNDTGAFGGITLTAIGTPTYGTEGPAGGIDKAVGFDSSSDGFTGTDTYDVTATDDLCLAWVGKWSAVPSTTEYYFVKGDSGAARWYLRYDTGKLRFGCTSASGTIEAQISDISSVIGLWHAGMLVIDRGTGKARVAVCALDGSSLLISSEVTPFAETTANADPFTIGNRSSGGTNATSWLCSAAYVGAGAGVATGLSANLATAVQNFANAINSSWTVALGADGRVSISNSFWDYSLTWTSTTLRDLLGFDADIASVQTATGASAAHGVWCPNAAMDVGESDPRRAPRVTDLRTTTSPTGIVKGLTGTGYYRHQNVRWPLVPESRTWEAAADYAGGSWETFFADTQLGEHSWFDVCSPIQIYDHNGLRVGSDKDVAGWQITGISDINPKRVGAWTGLWRIEIPQIVSSG